MELLSKVLAYMQTDLTRGDRKLWSLSSIVQPTDVIVHALVEYLCARLRNKDEIPSYSAGVRWTANSLYALAKMTARFPKGDASDVTQAVFILAKSSFREQLPATRLAVFKLLDFLVETYATTITRDMGSEAFVQGLVDLAEFEKDPRCLQILFETYADISRNWTLKPGSYKAMWDSFSRYFPITLKTTDPSIPGREELQSLLISCFASNDAYAAQVFPYLFDGLDTTEEALSTYVKVIPQSNQMRMTLLRN
jgi:DNA repair/transcription protein MET18/MMS19